MKSISETTCIYTVKPYDVIYFCCQGFGFVKEDLFLGHGAARVCLKVGEGQYKQNDIN